MVSYKSIIYISHPYGGDDINKEIVEKLVKRFQKVFPDYLFVSPIHAFGHCYFDVSHEAGLEMCLWLLEQCDVAWVFGDWKTSKGCIGEIEHCKKFGIYYQIMNDNCLQIKGEPRKCVDCELMEPEENWMVCNKAMVQKTYLEVVKDVEQKGVM